jgi:hypothetical protein
MQARFTTPVTSAHPSTIRSAPAMGEAAAPRGDAPLAGIERLMADALTALHAPAGAGAGPTDAGSIEYASWLPLLRRARP